MVQPQTMRLNFTKISPPKILFIFFVGTLFVFTTSGCRKKSSSNNKEQAQMSSQQVAPIDFDFDKIKERGELIAVVDNSSTGYFIYKGQPMGFEYDLLDRLARDLGVELKVELTADIEVAFDMLNKGQADIMAYHLTVTKERAQKVNFTNALNEVKQVLIQRKPDNWRQLKQHEIEAGLIRKPLDLVGKEVYIRKGSAFSSRLTNLSDEIGGDIIVVEESGRIDTETLIKRVADGEIDFTIADSDIGLINSTYYSNIDANTEISFSQRIAWALRTNSTMLQDTVNNWLSTIKAKPDFNVIYDRYFKYAKSQFIRTRSDFSSAGGGKISSYDDILKQGAQEINIDWMLLASQVYQESKFDPSVESWAGAKGLMQLTDISIEQYNVKDPFNPEESLRAGIRHMQWLDKLWSDKVENEEERIKFVLASYNVGQGHVLDAVRLSRKYASNSESWEDVAHYLVEKSKSEYYNDPVVSFGYCRGQEPVNYVTEVLNRYEQYKTLFGSNMPSDSLKVTGID